MNGIIIILAVIVIVIAIGIIIASRSMTNKLQKKVNVLQKRMEQLQKEKEKAENSNKVKTEFISNMSLEIRTQLNSIVGFSEDIQSHRTTAEPKVVEDADYVLEASKRLLEIVDSILDVNQIENNNMKITEEEYNLKEIVDSLSDSNASKIGRKSINLEIDIAEDIPHKLLGDKTHIKAIINNLLTDAITNTDQGNLKLDIKGNRTNDFYTLMIRINNKSSKDKTKNISLTITKALVEMMNGQYTIETNENQESKIVVVIPQKVSNQSTPDNNEKKEENTNSEIQIEVPKAFGYAGKRILIVDDNQLNIKVARRALEGFEFKIDECTDGQECIERIEEGNEYDLILMDIMMPNMSGEEALLRLKEKKGFHIPVIALTADADTGAKEKYLSAGFVDYIAKPFNKEQIAEKLDNVFNSTLETSNSLDEVSEILASEPEKKDNIEEL